MKEYLKKWHLTNPEKLVTTHTSDVYKVFDDSRKTLILKYLNDVGKEDEAGGGALLKWYAGSGAVNLINEDDGAHLLEYADGEELAEVVKKLHAQRETDAPQTLVPLREWFRELFEAAENSNNETIKLAAKVAEELFSTTHKAVPLHGDLHHHNIMASKRGWFAIDPKGLIGDPCYDLANFYGNPENMQEFWLDVGRINMLTDMFANELGYPRDRLLKFSFVHNVISSVWSGGSDVDRKARLDVAKLVYSQL